MGDGMPRRWLSEPEAKEARASHERGVKVWKARQRARRAQNALLRRGEALGRLAMPVNPTKMDKACKRYADAMTALRKLGYEGTP